MGHAKFSEVRSHLELMVRAGYLTTDEAAEVADTITLLIDYVAIGALAEEDAHAIIGELAEEKAAAYHERAHGEKANERSGLSQHH